MKPIIITEDTECVVCSCVENEESMILCDKCNKGFHLWCLDEPRIRIPRGKWFCQDCEDSTEIASKCECGVRVLSKQGCIAPIQDPMLGFVKMLPNCQSCGAEVFHSHDPSSHLWKEVASNPDNYPESKGEDPNKKLINRYISTEIQKHDPDHQKKILVLDGEQCSTTKELHNIGYNTDQIVCPNNTSTCLIIRGSKLNIPVPMSVQTYLEGNYQKIFPLHKFGALILDFCGGLKELTNCRIFENAEDKALILVTLSKRSISECCDKAQAWLKEEAQKHGFEAKMVLEHHYSSSSAMFTLIYQIERKTTLGKRKTQNQKILDYRTDSEGCYEYLVRQKGKETWIPEKSAREDSQEELGAFKKRIKDLEEKAKRKKTPKNKVLPLSDAFVWHDNKRKRKYQ
jgi:hypothetical protein